MSLKFDMTVHDRRDTDAIGADSFVKIGEAARFLGVSERQLRRWDEQGVLVPERRTVSGHRRYSVRQLQRAAADWKDKPKRAAPKQRREGVPLPFENDEE